MTAKCYSCNGTFDAVPVDPPYEGGRVEHCIFCGSEEVYPVIKEDPQ